MKRIYEHTTEALSTWRTGTLSCYLANMLALRNLEGAEEQARIAGEVLSQRKDHESVIAKKRFVHQLLRDVRGYCEKDEEQGRARLEVNTDFTRYAFAA